MQPLKIDCMAIEVGTWYIVIALWEMVWKGLAMWKSAKNNQKYWFIAVFVFNTVGLLPLLYLYFFQKKKRYDIIETEPLNALEKLEPLPELKESKPKKAVKKRKVAKKKKVVKRKATVKKKK